MVSANEQIFVGSVRSYALEISEEKLDRIVDERGRQWAKLEENEKTLA